MPSGPPPYTPQKVPNLTLWVNTTLNRLMSSYNAVSSSVPITLKQGDTVGVEIHILSSDSSDNISEYEMPQSSGLTLAIGRIDTAPTSGDFKLSFNNEETALIQYNATASQVQSALNALTSITALGGVSVIKNGTIYRITWNVQCVVSHSINIVRNTLYPSSSIAISRLSVGSALGYEMLQMHIKQAPVANITSFEDQDPSIATVTRLKNSSFSGDINIWRVEMKIKPKGGSFTILFQDAGNWYATNTISVDSSALDLSSKLESKLNTDWSVVKNSNYSWDICTTRSSITTFQVDSSSIISYISKYGILDLNTVQVEELLSGNASSTAIIEIQLDSNGTNKTLYQGDCTILNDLIDSDQYSIVEWGNYIPADSVIRYDTSQSLTTLEKLQARTNIGAIDNSAIASVVQTGIDLGNRISILETSSLDSNKINSINANNTLTANNPVISSSQLTTALTAYAPTIHTHIISNITGLQDALNNKSNSSHTHDYTTIAGLTNALALKIDTTVATGLFSTISHTHNAFTNIAVNNLDCFGTITTATINATNISVSGNTSFVDISSTGLTVGKFLTNGEMQTSDAVVYGTIRAQGYMIGGVNGTAIRSKVVAQDFYCDNLYLATGTPWTNQFATIESYQPYPSTATYDKEIVIKDHSTGNSYRVACIQV
jgi:hypothetical protein